VADALKFRPKAERVRLVYTNSPGTAMPDNVGKVFAVVGPFEGFDDKADLRDMLEVVIRGWNLIEG
jgi:hypothetical protein